MRVSTSGKAVFPISLSLLLIAGTEPTKTRPRPLEPGTRYAIVPWLSISASGTMLFGELESGLVHYDSEWRDQEQRFNLNPATGFPKCQSGKYELRAIWGTQAGTCVLSQRVRVESQSVVVYEADIRSRAGLPTKAVGLAIFLPGIKFRGESIGVGDDTVVLPEPVGAASELIYSRTAERLRIPMDKGELVIEGKVPVIVQDNRPYGEDSYMIRLSMTPNEGDLREASIRLRLMRSDEAEDGSSIERQAD